MIQMMLEQGYLIEDQYILSQSHVVHLCQMYVYNFHTPKVQ